jgi:hypothetical protein
MEVSGQLHAQAALPPEKESLNSRNKITIVSFPVAEV